MTAVAAASVADAPELAVLHALCFDDAWDADAISELLAGPGVFALAVRRAAFILARAAGGEAEILTLATAPQVRRRGLARALVLAAAEEAGRRNATEIFLEVAADNPAALALYAGLGFERAGQRRLYYARPQGAADALILRAALPLSKAGSLFGIAGPDD